MFNFMSHILANLTTYIIRTFFSRKSGYRAKIIFLQLCHQATSKGHLSEHKRAIHERVKYPCGQCGQQFTQKGNLAKHKREVHEGVKYPCRQCNHKATSKGNLAEHKRAVHKGVKYPCTQCNHQATTGGSQIPLRAMQPPSNI